jgi:hypothetical protein
MRFLPALYLAEQDGDIQCHAANYKRSLTKLGGEKIDRSRWSFAKLAPARKVVASSNCGARFATRDSSTAKFVGVVTLLDELLPWG